MESPCEDWRTNRRTLKARQKFFLNNEFASDIKFLLSNGDRVFAHKLFLSVHSPVFAAMFHGPLATKEDSIELSDCDDKVHILEFLKYLYCEECELSWENLFTILYLSKKYLVSVLEEKCLQFASADLNLDTVFPALRLAANFGEKSLQQKCFDFICPNIREILKTDHFLQLDLDTLKIVLREDNLYVNEIEIFKAVDKWCERQSDPPGNPSSDPTGKRRLLGDAVYLIRFPIMEVSDFSTHCARSGFLTPEECCDLFCFLNRTKKSTSDDDELTNELTKLHLFPRKKRCESLHQINEQRVASILSRQAIINRSDKHYNDDKTDGLGFEVDKPIKLVGVTLFGDPTENRILDFRIADNDLSEVMFANPDCVFFTDQSQKCSSGSFRMLFQTGVNIMPRKKYSIHLKMTGPASNSGTYGCSWHLSKDGIRFSFHRVHSPNGTDPSKGQFPELLYYNMEQNC